MPLCFAKIHSHMYSLGDSGFIHFRNARILWASSPQTHSFNTPYQLSIVPPKMRAQAAVFGGDYLEDHPHDAGVSNLRMQHGDILILMTDGVFDNLDHAELLRLVTGRMVLTGAWNATTTTTTPPTQEDWNGVAVVSNRLSSLTGSPEEEEKEEGGTIQGLLAATIAGEAKRASHNFRRDGPFAKEAQQYFPGGGYRGGKVDDICVLVIVAVDESVE